LRAAGRSDADISGFIRGAIGREVSPDAIERFYASPEERRGGGRS